MFSIYYFLFLLAVSFSTVRGDCTAHILKKECLVDCECIWCFERVNGTLEEACETAATFECVTSLQACYNDSNLLPTPSHTPKPVYTPAPTAVTSCIGWMSRNDCLANCGCIWCLGAGDEALSTPCNDPTVTSCSDYTYANCPIDEGSITLMLVLVFCVPTAIVIVGVILVFVVRRRRRSSTGMHGCLI